MVDEASISGMAVATDGQALKGLQDRRKNWASDRD